jgi:hypothetical protein
MVPRAVPLDKVIAQPWRRSPQVQYAKGRPHIGTLDHVHNNEERTPSHRHDRTPDSRQMRTCGHGNPPAFFQGGDGALVAGKSEGTWQVSYRSSDPVCGAELT